MDFSERLKALQSMKGTPKEELDAIKAAIMRIADETVDEAKQMRVPPEVQGVCPHSMVGKYDGDEYWCVDCGQRVYPDPDWFDKGFLLYGGK